ncbi:MAG: hypothetical protein WBG30_14790 [Psychrilyobacter sp.]|uniref:hypothetical protein n=1 Tax=Psychrilyobacter sp. TaxID=2586924 RepID=UPI003C76DB41
MIKIILIVSILSFILILFKKKRNQAKPNFIFVNKKTKKYHQEECPYAKNLETITLQEAIKNGYTSCKICEKNKI